MKKCALNRPQRTADTPIRPAWVVMAMVVAMAVVMMVRGLDGDDGVVGRATTECVESIDLIKIAHAYQASRVII